MSKEWQLSLLTPEKPIFQGVVQYLEVPSAAGRIGLLPGHASSVILLSAGSLKIYQDITSPPWTKTFFVQGGFLKIQENHTTILVEKIMPSEARDSAIKNEAQAELEEHMRAKKERVTGVLGLEMQYRKLARLRSCKNGFTAVY